MNEMETTESHGMVTLDGLAVEARLYSESIATNMIQLGRVLHEAKKLVKHGEWGAWVHDCAGCSERTAQQFMQVYLRFGERAGFAHIEKSKLFKMLSLPAGAEEAFAEDNDLSAMSSREVEAAVKEYKDRLAQAEAEMKALRNRPPDIPDELTEALREKDAQIARQQAELARVAENGSDTIGELTKLRARAARQEEELRETTDMLVEAQQENQRIQDALLNQQSAIARGDTARGPVDTFTPEAFGAAVRQFIGTCARLPHMGPALSEMTLDERAQYDEWLRTVEAWAQDARRAMDTMTQEVHVE